MVIKFWSTITLGVTFGLWSIGSFEAFGFDGFARASEVRSVQSEVRQMRVTQLEDLLFNLRLKQCAADNPQLRVTLREEMTKRNRDYYELTGRNYEFAACEDLR